MKRKHGIIFPRKHQLASTASVFAQRGDPMVSPREQLRDFGRDVGNEDVEWDFDHRFHHTHMDSKIVPESAKAVELRAEADRLFDKSKNKKKRNAFDTPAESDIPLQLRATQEALKLHRQYPNKRVRETAGELTWITCPYACGAKFRDSFAVSRHLREKACKRK